MTLAAELQEQVHHLSERIATLEAEKQQLEAENRELREARDAFRDEANAVRRNLLAEVRDISERADAAESSLASLREAVRDKIDKLEGYGFECIAGPLEKAT